MKIKNILIGLAILFVLFSISSVSAIDLNDTQSLDNDFVTISNEDVQFTFQNDDKFESSVLSCFIKIILEMEILEYQLIKV